LRASISAADIVSAGDVLVSVGGSALPAATFRIVGQVTRVYMPLGRR
jgi:hypothetical protein